MTPSTHRVDTAELVRVGILAAPLAGALKLVGNLGTFNSIGYGIPPASEAAIAASRNFLIGELVGSTLPTVLTPFWVFALFAYLAPTGARRLLTTAMTCCLIGAGFTLAALGVVNYAIPAMAEAYLAGQPAAMAIADSFFTWPRSAIFLPAILVPVGSVLFAVAMWRSRALPRTAAALFAVATLLISAPGPIHTLHLAGGVLTLAAGIWISHAVRNRAADGRSAHSGEAGERHHGGGIVGS
jgi:hypothetical protein